MQKVFYLIIIVAVLAVGYWLASPLFIEEKISEEMPTAGGSAPIVIKGMGSFVGLAGHSGEGTAKIIESDGKHYLRFESDFRVTNGPDIFVYLGRDGEYDANARLAALKGNVGSQNYEIPEGIDPDDYNEVWVWCRAFSVPFAKAELR